MSFPAYLDVFGLRVHPHLVFETLGYFVGARIYFRLRQRTEEPLPLEKSLWLLVGCIFGAWAGSKLLAFAEAPRHYWELRHTPTALLGGKTIVGGLLGGWAGIEIAKRFTAVTRSTGDDFVWPIAVGTALGRIGCFLTGLEDRTYGIATSVPWAIDFGDGVHRHPTQIYESIFVLVLVTAVHFGTRSTRVQAGARFRLYLAAYLAFRFLVEFIKPREELIAELSAIQVASLTGALITVVSLIRLPPPHLQPRLTET